MIRQPVLTDERLTAHIDDLYGHFRKLSQMVRRGFMTQEERQTKMEAALFDAFRMFLWRNGLLLRIGNASWAAFSEDHKLWKTGKAPDSAADQPWLLYRRDEDKGLPEAEALPEDRAGFFRLMEALHLPEAYFKPVPEDVISPEWIPGHYPDQWLIGNAEGDYWTDDGGLLKAADPVGQAFILTDRLGLKTCLTIDEVKPDSYNPAVTIYKGKGMVEGYFAPEAREISLTVRDGRIIYLSAFKVFSEDTVFFEEFFLWDRYNRYMKKSRGLWDEALTSLISFFDREAN